MNDSKMTLTLTPRDLLFCRDAKPMESSWAGYGGALPGALTFHGAIIAAIYRAFAGEAERGNEEKISNSLRTTGLFLQKDGVVYFPVPLDVAPGNRLMQLRTLSGESDLPAFLEYAVAAPSASKETAWPWISYDNFCKYLDGNAFLTTKDEAFFCREARPGITIDSQSRTAVDGAYYSAEYLRLKNGIALTGEVALSGKEKLAQLFPTSGMPLQLGGQQSIVFADAKPEPFALPKTQISGKFVKWVLLTPAAWLNGWVPDFVAKENDPSGKEAGELLLRAFSGERPERLPGENRQAYRRRIAQSQTSDIRARLVAARVGKPVAISGWKQERDGGGLPRPTRLCVPAGSVYYFEAENEQEAQKLAQALQAHAYSAFGGTSGFGIGVCGNFQINK